jgi:hypothetical protein
MTLIGHGHESKHETLWKLAEYDAPLCRAGAIMSIACKKISCHFDNQISLDFIA